LRRISNYFLLDFSIYFSQQLHTYRLLSCIEQVYRHFDRCGTALGLVFDSVGFTCEYPWIDIVISGETEIGLPEKLALRKKPGRQLLQHNPDSEGIVREEGNSLILYSKEMWEWEESMRQLPPPSVSDNLGDLEENPGPRTIYG
jgi:hypothetical protein